MKSVCYMSEKTQISKTHQKSSPRDFRSLEVTLSRLIRLQNPSASSPQASEWREEGKLQWYCMSSVRFEIPKEWCCEECLRSREAVSNRHLPVQEFLHKRSLRKIETGKVKFISNKELVALTVGKRSHRRRKSTSGHRSDVAFVIPPPIPCSQTVKASFRPTKGPMFECISSEHTMKSKLVNAEKGKETVARMCKIEPAECNASAVAYENSLRTVDGLTSTIDKHIDNKAYLKPQNDCLFREPRSASVSIKEESDLGRKRDANVLPVLDSGTRVLSNSQFSQISSLKMLHPLRLAVSLDGKHHHAMEACWRGAFEVLDLVTQFRGTVQAHLPCQVSPKVYDISSHLPRTLQLKLLSRESVWPKIFKLNPPKKDDVALYFRCEVERCKEDYAHFIQHIDSHDYALQGCVADVELLLFTAAQLQTDSQKFGGNIYIWGVFRHVKKKKTTHGELPVKHVSEVGKEIDKVGGCPTGRIGVPIKLEDAPCSFSNRIRRPSAPPGFPIPAFKKFVTTPTGKLTKDPVSSSKLRS